MGMGNEKILVRVHGVPASFSIAEARERVGRPYLTDYTSVVGRDMDGVVDPLHVILCHKNITFLRA